MSAAKVMAYTVIVRDPDTGVPKAVLGGQPVPDWAKDLVHDDDLVKTSEYNGPDTSKSTGAPDPASAGNGDGGQGDGAPTEPPRAGKGSGGEAWTAYAKAIGIEVPDGASRDDVVTLVDARKDA